LYYSWARKHLQTSIFASHPRDNGFGFYLKHGVLITGLSNLLLDLTHDLLIRRWHGFTVVSIAMSSMSRKHVSSADINHYMTVATRSQTGRYMR